MELFLVEIFKGNAIFDILTQLLKNIAYIGSWKHFVLVFVCVCESLSFFMSSSWQLSLPDDEISENIWLHGLEHYTVEING